MGVPCPGCGREYDVALFQFGRTLHCTCGRRVGLEPRVRHTETDAREPRFAADAMLGRLARWLRVLGYDTSYESRIEDEGLVRRALLEDRILLTCDRALPEEWRVARYLLLQPEAPLEQLRQVVEHFSLDPDRPLFRRCTHCNQPVETVERAAVVGRVPARVLDEHDRFSRCPRCTRIYWEGSHTRRMRHTLRRVLGRS